MEANSACVALGGHLAQITSSQEDDAIRSLINGDAWIGLNDIATEGAYEWDKGALGVTPLAGYSNMGSGPSLLEDCVRIEEDGDWQDRLCSSYLSYVCERSFL